MNQQEAFRKTLALASDNNMSIAPVRKYSLSYEHGLEMYGKIVEAGKTFSDAKIGRWLGWFQAAVVCACPSLTVEDMKAINRSCED